MKQWRDAMANQATREFPGVDIDRIHQRMSDPKIEAHKRLQVALRDRTRTHRNRFPDGNDHSRHPRDVDAVLVAQVREYIERGYSPSTIRSHLHIGYGTIRRVLALISK